MKRIISQNKFKTANKIDEKAERENIEICRLFEEPVQIVNDVRVVVASVTSLL